MDHESTNKYATFLTFPNKDCAIETYVVWIGIRLKITSTYHTATDDYVCSLWRNQGNWFQKPIRETSMLATVETDR